MKRPSISFDKEAIVDFLLRHGEKFVVSLVALLALGLAWGGLDAMTSKAASEQQSPQAIERNAEEAARHIEQEKTAPATEKRSAGPLAKAIDPWRNPDVAEPPSLALLDRPLFEESAKRSQPDVYPIEDLRAVAGLAVLPVKAATEPPPGQRPRPRGEPEPAGGERSPLEPGPGLFGPAGPQPVAGDQFRGRIVPYVVVTGLIPVSRQTAEYRRRFEGVGFQDARRDAPLWADWVIERTVVAAGGERWEKIDLVDAGRRAVADWTGAAPERLPESLLLGGLDKRNPKTTPPYCGPLPLLLKGSWGISGVHPWVLDQMRRQQQPAGAAPEQPAVEPGVEPGTDVFGDNQAAPGAGPPTGAVAPGQPVAGGPLDPGATGGEFRMFRFIDTAVEPGKSYRYRVRHELWNPNYKVPTQHLEKAALAQEMKLPSPSSKETPAVTVPDSTTTLVGMLRKADMKKFKPGYFELLVLGPSKETGDYKLRGLITEAGGLVNVDGRLNKPGDRRTRGEEITTDRVVVDMRGRQEERSEAKTPRPPEPFEVLCLRPDGGFEFVSAADSEATLSEHAATLPAAEGGKPEGAPGQPDPVSKPFTL
jgi:hypothetical protein